MEIKIEYLIVYKIQGNYLDNINGFKHLLMLNSLLTFKENSEEILFNKKKFSFKINSHEIENKNQRLFKFTLYSKEDNIDEFIILLKLIREGIYKSNGKISIIWDDISSYYSKLAYPQINKIENLLRKLITFFMVSKLGLEWTEESTPKEVKSNTRNSRDNNNYLHDTDFIQLADYLFKTYPEKNVEILFKEIKNNDDFKEKDFNYLEKFIPKSNWERYFNSFVDCEDGYLIKQWNRLYELRCLIAHNSFITKKEYEEINKIVLDLTEKFEKAILSIDEIIISSSDKALIYDNMVINQSILTNKYLDIWKKITEDITIYYRREGFKFVQDKTLKQIIDGLISLHVIGPEFYFKLSDLIVIKTNYVNSSQFVTQEIVQDLEEFYYSQICFKPPFYK
ncbi:MULTISPECIES: HEPN domain-containing protein [unclassified Chryseobacterium]|uniref:HEPN domain-containing protein n=1 Tax=unclassified Chryseobacterium TaxID=2593645 RepID=UPI002269D293|nr:MULTISPECIES: HEPN domain-containing protein [unclassified Chryseobacterium]